LAAVFKTLSDVWNGAWGKLIVYLTFLKLRDATGNRIFRDADVRILVFRVLKLLVSLGQQFFALLLFSHISLWGKANYVIVILFLSVFCHLQFACTCWIICVFCSWFDTYCLPICMSISSSSCCSFWWPVQGCSLRL